MNPSLLGFYPVASAMGSFDWQNPNGNATKLFNLAVIDGRNELFLAGAGWTRRQQGDFIHFAVAKQVVPWLSFGAHGKRFATRNAIQEVEGHEVVAYDGGASASIAFSQKNSKSIPFPFSLGITADNLRHNKGDERYIGPREYGIGGKININDILLGYIDYAIHDSRYGSYATYSPAVEIALGNDFYARGGWFGIHDTGWSAGAGWVGPKIGLNYGYQKQTQPTKSFEHLVTMDIFM